MNRTTRCTGRPEGRGLWDAVGGGGAGLSAGMVLTRAPFTTAVVDGGQPRNEPANDMHGYLARDGMAPRKFLAVGKDKDARYCGTLARGTVVDACRSADGTFELELDNGELLRSRPLLVATGLHDGPPDIPGLRERWGPGVHHCPHCHDYEVRERAIAVVANPATATTESGSAHLAAPLRRYSDQVVFCLNGTEIGPAGRRRLEAYGVRTVDGPVVRVGPGRGPADAGPVTIELGTGATVVADAIFAAPRLVPRDRILTMLAAPPDPASGPVGVGSVDATEVRGVWAAGNVANPRAQVVTAAGAGSAAAIAMTAWLLGQELAAAIAPGGRTAGGASR
ncbi:thioredoxin reductase [Prauserella shujinwangii]|uniref:Thioredoxin reductase n=1 Tax=Prauserella shujinwangii TaxID=1453103 RepID=A0A2T0M2G3_9PSEU|nr:FAD-dependent oxidoreductase [Prauserella shujinwangii]PRX50910.1 thioredoxin reductase [Prauserella shujinwangii]